MKKALILAALLSAVAGVAFGGGEPAKDKPAPAVSPSDVSSNPDSIAMVFVKGGKLRTGMLRKRTVRSFYIARYETTWELWRSVKGYNPPFKSERNLPVQGIDWTDVQEFIQELNAKTGKKYRLPTGAEWEYAARGGNKSKGYIFSGSNNIDKVAWYKENSGGNTHPVGTKKANELGIYDMTGNALELTDDITYDSRRIGYHTYRGGCWGDDKRLCLISYRHIGLKLFEVLGFRLVLDP